MTSSPFTVAAATGFLAFSLNLDSPRQPPAPARVSVTIDTSGADVVLAAALADPDHAPHAADVALQNPAVRAMIAKMAMYDSSVTAAAFKSAIVRIGFGGPWDETGYYVGYRMAKTIDRYAGRERLKALVSLPPEQFVADYIALTNAHPNDPDITPLSRTSVETVEELMRSHAQGAATR